MVPCFVSSKNISDDAVSSSQLPCRLCLVCIYNIYNIYTIGPHLALNHVYQVLIFKETQEATEDL